MNYKLTISYDGSNYSGWQIQPSEKTIQGEIQDSIRQIFNNKSINLIGSGRTDSGVHANNQVANFNTNTNISLEKVKDAINSKIDNDIYIKSCEIVDDDFHSRFSAIKRNYIYKISTSYNVFNRNSVWCVRWKLDKKKLNQCANFIKEQIDFRNFCKGVSQKQNNMCQIFISEWSFDQNSFIFRIEANRFLHHMVRFLVGTMVEVSRGRYKFSEFESMFKDGKKISVLKSPSHGLILNKIYF